MFQTAKFTGTNYNLENNGLGHLNKTIASSSLRLLNFVAYLESHSVEQAGGNQQLQLALNDSTNSEKITKFKHIFVEINGDSIYNTGNPNLINNSSDYSQFEDIDIKVICDKFSQNKNGLKDLYDKGPQDAFFLVKCWVGVILNRFFLLLLSMFFKRVLSSKKLFVPVYWKYLFFMCH